MAADILLTGRTSGGSEAAALGVADRAPPAERVRHAMALARDIAVNVAPTPARASPRSSIIGRRASPHSCPCESMSLPEP